VQVTAKININGNRVHSQEFNWGVDCDSYWQEKLTSQGGCRGDPNHGGVTDGPASGCCNDGKPACSTAIDEPKYFLDGGVTPWTGGLVEYLMKFSNSDGDKELQVYWDIFGTEYQKEHDGVPKDEWDIALEYHGYIKRFIHFMDLRHPFIASFTELISDEWINPVEVGQRFTMPQSILTSQIFQKEAYVVDSDDSEYISNTTIHDVSVTGNSIGYDWKGNMLDEKPDIKGPNWPFNKDLSYTHTDPTGKFHEYRTVYATTGWQEGLDKRSVDYDIIEPKLDLWYTGSLNIHKWPSWMSFFNNTQYDDILGMDVHLNAVDGGFARSDTDWVVSYKEPEPAGADAYANTGKVFNYINEQDVTYLGDNIAKALHPLGVY
jgi:hypothetical protein